MAEYFLIARVRRAHGLKGELLLESFTFDDSRFKKLTHLFRKDPDGAFQELHIIAARSTQQGPLITLAGINNRTEAERLHGIELYLPLSERAKLPAGRAYFDQIIGMNVIDDATNGKLGVVEDLMEMPAGDVLVIRLLDGREHLVTMNGEEVRSIDTKKNELRVLLLAEFDGRSSGEKL